MQARKNPIISIAYASAIQSHLQMLNVRVSAAMLKLYQGARARSFRCDEVARPLRVLNARGDHFANRR